MTGPLHAPEIVGQAVVVFTRRGHGDVKFSERGELCSPTRPFKNGENVGAVENWDLPLAHVAYVHSGNFLLGGLQLGGRPFWNFQMGDRLAKSRGRTRSPLHKETAWALSC